MSGSVYDIDYLHIMFGYSGYNIIKHEKNYFTNNIYLC
jgi:hypothetical protein